MEILATAIAALAFVLSVVGFVWQASQKKTDRTRTDRQLFAMQYVAWLERIRDAVRDPEQDLERLQSGPKDLWLLSARVESKSREYRRFIWAAGELCDKWEANRAPDRELDWQLQTDIRSLAMQVGEWAEFGRTSEPIEVRRFRGA